MVLYAIIIISLYVSFSGTPYRNQTYATKMRKLGIIFLLWSLCIMPKAILNLLNLSGFPDQDDSRGDLVDAIVLFLV